MSEFDELDHLVRAAMRGRPEAFGELRGEALAAAAIQRAAGAEIHAVRLAKVARWMRISSVATGILLVLALALGGYWYKAAASTETGVNVATGVEGDTLNITSSTVDLSLVGWMVLGVVVVGLAVKLVMVPERQGFGLGYA